MQEHQNLCERKYVNSHRHSQLRYTQSSSNDNSFPLTSAATIFHLYRQLRSDSLRISGFRLAEPDVKVCHFPTEAWFATGLRFVAARLWFVAGEFARI